MLARTGRHPELAQAIEEKVKLHSHKSKTQVDEPETNEARDHVTDRWVAAAQSMEEGESTQTAPTPWRDPEDLDAIRSRLRKAASKRDAAARLEEHGTAKKKFSLRVPVEEIPPIRQESISYSLDVSVKRKLNVLTNQAERRFLKKGQLQGGKDTISEKTKTRCQLRKTLLKALPVPPILADPQEPGVAGTTAYEAHQPLLAPGPPAQDSSNPATQFPGTGRQRGLGEAHHPLPVPGNPSGARKRGLQLGKTLSGVSPVLDKQGRLVHSQYPTPPVAQVTGIQASAQEKQPQSDNPVVSTHKQTDTSGPSRKTAVPQSVYSKRLIVPVIVALLVCAWGIYMLVTLRIPSSVNTTWWTRYGGRSFATSDGRMSLLFAGGNAELTDYASQHTAFVRYLEGNWKDELDLLSGSLDASQWVSETTDGLETNDRIVLYAKDAPENKVTAQMQRVADAAQEFFHKNNRYPQSSSDLASLKPYNNPFTGATETIRITSSVGKALVEDASKTDFERKLESGGEFIDEAGATPGAIHAFLVLCHPIYSAETNTYNWSSQSFLVHGFDRRGALIGCSDQGKVLLITLKNGRNASPVATPHWLNRDRDVAQLCLSKNPKPQKTDIWLKYGFLLFAVVVFAGAMIYFNSGFGNLFRQFKGLIRRG